MLLWGALPVRFLTACERRYGAIFTMRFPGQAPGVVVSDPAGVRDVFALRPDEFTVNEATGVILEPFLGARSLLLLDGERHREERKMLVHAFRGEHLSAHAATVRDVTRREVGRWPLGREFAAHDAMQAITIEVILRVVFGMEGEALRALREPLQQFLEDGGSFRVLIPALRRDLGRLTPWARFVRNRTYVRQAVLELIAARRTDPALATRNDVLSLLVQAFDGAALDDGALLDELMTMVLAGQDTTATALSWAFDLLVHHPAVLERLSAELATDDDDDAYLDAVIYETLRLRPVIPEVGRVLSRPIRLGAYDLPAGTSLTANVLLAHRRPDVYPDPLIFRPERFLEGAPDPHAWIPFGGGARRCLGSAFAMLEVREVLRTVLTSVQLRAASPRMERPRRRVVTLIPRRGTRVVVSAI
jgi:cytochrome P450 family 135